MSDHLAQLARMTAGHSKDPSTKVGAVVSLNGVILGKGYNRVPEKVPYEDLQLEDRTWKYPRIVHAEKSAMIQALKVSIPSSAGLTIHVTTIPCMQCAAFLIESGITRVICPEPPAEILARWPDMLETKEFLETAGVEVVFQEF